MEILFNQYVIIILRLLHIVGGALWVGGGVLYGILLMPAIKSADSAGQTVMKKFAPRFHTFMAVLANTTILSGALLYSRFFIGVGVRWVWSSPTAIAFTFGAVAGIISYGMGAGFFAPTQKKIEALAAKMAVTSQPSADQITQMNNLQASMMKANQLDFVLLMSALGAMAVARYL